MLSVVALGGAQIKHRNQLIDLRSRKAAALIAFLALHPTGTETRERLCGLLWSDSPPDKARASLRQVLHGLRSALEEVGFGGFHLDRETVRLDPSRVSVDTRTILLELEQRRIPAALASLNLPHEALMEGFDGLDPDLDVWLTIQRRLWRERLEGLLFPLASGGHGSDVMIAAATVLMNIDPTNEDACRTLMRVRAERGEVSAALKIYNALWEHLADEYDMEPSAETQALAVELKSLPPHNPTSTGGELTALIPNRLADKPLRYAVIVGDIDTRGIPEEAAYLVSGLRQELISRLVRFREWAIFDGRHLQTDRLDAFRARWPDHVFLETYVFEQRGQLKVSFSLRLQDAGNIVWSDSFQCRIADWFEVERELVSRISATLNIHVSTARLIDAAGAPDVSLDIYDRWLRGQAIIMNWKPERDLARSIYTGILEEAPHFSPAHSSLAQLENMEHLALPGTFRTSERERRGLDHARQALRYDPFDSRAHLAFGWGSAMNSQFDQAYSAFQTALQLNENDPWTINSAALGCAYCGDIDKGRASLDQALTWGLKPTAFHAAYQGAIHFMAGDYRSALVAYDQAGDIIGDLAAWKAATLAKLGATEQAKATMNHFRAHVAKRWTGDEPPTDERMAAWFLHCFPMRSREVWDNLREGVEASGLKVPDEATIPRHPPSRQPQWEMT